MNPADLLKHVPDFTLWKEAQDWIELGQEKIKELTSQNVLNVPFAYFDGNQINELSQNPFGLYSSELWRKFVLAVFLADLVSYPKPSDRVNFERLLFVVHNFPQGFRTWWVQFNDFWWPVGYTGWYPMLETTYNLFKNSPEKLKDRLVVSNGCVDNHPYLYLFNYSVAAVFKKSDLTSQLMQKYVKDILATQPAGLACITVSEDGVRVAEQFELIYRGDLTFHGSVEGVYTTK